MRNFACIVDESCSVVCTFVCRGGTPAWRDPLCSSPAFSCQAIEILDAKVSIGDDPIEPGTPGGGSDRHPGLSDQSFPFDRTFRPGLFPERPGGAWHAS